MEVETRNFVMRCLRRRTAWRVLARGEGFDVDAHHLRAVGNLWVRIAQGSPAEWFSARAPRIAVVRCIDGRSSGSVPISPVVHLLIITPACHKWAGHEIIGDPGSAGLGACAVSGRFWFDEM
jgi:hypothetical protein